MSINDPARDAGLWLVDGLIVLVNRLRHRPESLGRATLLELVSPYCPGHQEISIDYSNRDSLSSPCVAFANLGLLARVSQSSVLSGNTCRRRNPGRKVRLKPHPSILSIFIIVSEFLE